MGRYQTQKITIYINNQRQIFLDCQPISSASMITDFIFQSRRKTRAMDQIETIVINLFNIKFLEHSIGGAFNGNMSYNNFIN